MINTTTTTLQIKTRDANLSAIETIYILIKQSDFQTAKSNDDIEVDGDIITVLLTKDEVQQLKSGGGTRVSVTAVDKNQASFDVKVAWVKIGSISNRDTDNGGGGGGTSPPTILGIFEFQLRDDGCLWIVSDDNYYADKFYINDDGDLIYRLEV